MPLLPIFIWRARAYNLCNVLFSLTPPPPFPFHMCSFLLSYELRKSTHCRMVRMQIRSSCDFSLRLPIRLGQYLRASISRLVNVHGWRIEKRRRKKEIRFCCRGLETDLTVRCTARNFIVR